MANDNYHVASFVVHAQPEKSDAVRENIGRLDGLEVHAAQDGKLVVTAEGADVRDIARLSERLEALENVLAVAPVYHEYDATDERNSRASSEN